MIRALRQRSTLFSHVLMTLAVLAVAMKVLIPQGFMAAPATNDLPFALVICTGEGMVTVAPGEAIGQHDPAKPSDINNHNGPCLFAGNGPAVDAPLLADVAAPVFHVAQPVEPQPLTDLAPGRGLSAPPLPARGPPTFLI